MLRAVVAGGLSLALVALVAPASARAGVLGPDAGPAILRAVGPSPLPGGWSLSDVGVEADHATLTWQRGEATAVTILREGTPFTIGAGTPALPDAARAELARRLATMESPWLDASTTPRVTRPPGPDESRSRVGPAAACVAVLLIAFAALRRRPLEVAVAALALSAVAAWAWWADDAFITFHYVRRLLDGDGLVFNAGERVQGFTHPLWLFAVAALSTLSPIPMAAMALGMLFTLALLLTLARLVEALDGTPTAFALLGALLFSSNAFLSFQTSALEGSLVHWLVAAVALASLTRRSLWPTVLLASLAMCTRLDTLLLTAPFVVLAWRRGATADLRAALATLPLLGWLAFAAFYFGYPLPNTYYAKTGEPLGGRLLRGLSYLTDWVAAEPLAATCVVLALVLGVQAFRRRDLAQRPFVLAASSAVASQLLYVVYVGGDYMRGRFITGALLLAALIVVVRTRHLLAERRALAVAVAVAALGFASTLLPGRDAVSIDERAFHGAPSTWYDAPRDFFAPGAETGGPFLTAPVVGFDLIRDAYGEDPRIVWLDGYGLTDPFIARCVAPTVQRAGHVERLIPIAYFRARGDVRLHPRGAARLMARDPSLADEVRDARAHPDWPNEETRRRYEELRLLTRAPLTSSGRLSLILRYTFGRPAVPAPPPDQVFNPKTPIEWE